MDDRLAVQIRNPMGRMPCPPGWMRTRENSLSLRDWEFWFVWRGVGRMFTAEREFVLNPGFCALMRPGGIYDVTHDAPNLLGIAYIHFDVLDAPGDPDAWPEFFDAEEVGYVDTLVRRILDLHPDRDDTASALLAGLVMDTLRWPEWGRTRTEPVITRHGRMMSEFALRIRNSEFGPNPTVAELAAAAHLGPAHFSRLFQQVNGVPPRELLIRHRVEQARHLLQESSLTVAQIAAELGYKDAAYFSRQFTDRVGMPPTDYRAGKRN